MNRRAFHRAVLTAMGAWSLDPPRLWPAARSEMGVNGARILEHLDALAEIGKTPEGGVRRVAYSPADREARGYVMGVMREAGLDTHVDAAGNIIGRRKGVSESLPPLALGSHIDSVPQGGRYDGPLGTLGAIEVARTLEENDVTTRHRLEVIVFENEENGKTGSRALIGEISDADLERVTPSGKTVREGIEYIGGDPSRIDEVRRRKGDIAAFLELHIEQGAILDAAKIDIGVVEGIVGIRRWYVAIDGFANHAGTTPMDIRRDALLAGARFVQAVNRLATETPGRQVATVGQIQAFPGAPNVIPGRVTMSLEIRDLDMNKIDALFETMKREAETIGRATGTTFDFDPFYTSEGAPTDERLRELVAEAAHALGLRTRRMPSGAGHDAQSMAKLGPVGMIFIPSVDGISHSPKEYSRPEDIVHGVDVLLRTLLKVDRSL